MKNQEEKKEKNKVDEKSLHTLYKMGFSLKLCKKALEACNGGQL